MRRNPMEESSTSSAWKSPTRFAAISHSDASKAFRKIHGAARVFRPWAIMKIAARKMPRWSPVLSAPPPPRVIHIFPVCAIHSKIAGASTSRSKAPAAQLVRACGRRSRLPVDIARLSAPSRSASSGYPSRLSAIIVFAVGACEFLFGAGDQAGVFHSFDCFQQPLHFGLRSNVMRTNRARCPARSRRRIPCSPLVKSAGPLSPKIRQKEISRARVGFLRQSFLIHARTTCVSRFTPSS